MFQACSDEEDAENDDLNDAGEFFTNTPLFSEENQDFIPSQRVLGLWEWRLCRQQPCNIEQQHKSDQRGYFQLKTNRLFHVENTKLS